MKRRSFLCLLLAVLLGLTACTPAAEESGAPSSADSDALSGEASAPEESGPTTEPFEPVYRTVVSRGKPYTGPTAVDSYPDTYGSELTDGLLVASVDDDFIGRGDIDGDALDLG